MIKRGLIRIFGDIILKINSVPLCYINSWILIRNIFYLIDSVDFISMLVLFIPDSFKAGRRFILDLC